MPVNFGNLRKPKQQMVWVALAGPASNFVQAVAWGVVLITMVGMGVDERFFIEMARAGVQVNLVMWAFNLPCRRRWTAGAFCGPVALEAGAHGVAHRALAFFIVMALVIAGVVGSLWLRPLMSLGYSTINLLLTPLTALLR